MVAVGEGCTRIKVGDFVHGMTFFHKTGKLHRTQSYVSLRHTGTLSEFVAIDESAVETIAPNLSLPQAAALPLVSLTSYNSLVTLGKIKAGSRVLVLGGSTATGLMAIQLAKAYGASHVVVTCSPRNNQLVKSLGANQTVDYRAADAFHVMRKAGQEFDLIYDTVGVGRSVWDEASSGALAPRGQLVTITGDVQRTLDIWDLLVRGYQIVSRKLYCITVKSCGYHQYTQPGGSDRELRELNKLVREGKLRVVVDKQYKFDLAEVKEAFRYLMAGHATGKVVIIFKEPKPHVRTVGRGNLRM